MKSVLLLPVAILLRVYLGFAFVLIYLDKLKQKRMARKQAYAVVHRRYAKRHKYSH